MGTFYGPNGPENTDKPYDVVKVVPQGFVLYNKNDPTFVYFGGQTVPLKNGIIVNYEDSNWVLVDQSQYQTYQNAQQNQNYREILAKYLRQYLEEQSDKLYLYGPMETEEELKKQIEQDYEIIENYMQTRDHTEIDAEDMFENPSEVLRGVIYLVVSRIARDFFYDSNTTSAYINYSFSLNQEEREKFDQLVLDELAKILDFDSSIDKKKFLETMKLLIPQIIETLSYTNKEANILLSKIIEKRKIYISESVLKEARVDVFAREFIEKYYRKNVIFNENKARFALRLADNLSNLSKEEIAEQLTRVLLDITNKIFKNEDEESSGYKAKFTEEFTRQLNLLRNLSIASGKYYLPLLLDSFIPYLIDKGSNQKVLSLVNIDKLSIYDASSLNESFLSQYLYSLYRSGSLKDIINEAREFVNLYYPGKEDFGFYWFLISPEKLNIEFPIIKNHIKKVAFEHMKSKEEYERGDAVYGNRIRFSLWRNLIKSLTEHQLKLQSSPELAAARNLFSLPYLYIHAPEEIKGIAEYELSKVVNWQGFNREILDKVFEPLEKDNEMQLIARQLLREPTLIYDIEHLQKYLPLLNPNKNTLQKLAFFFDLFNLGGTSEFIPHRKKLIAYVFLNDLFSKVKDEEEREVLKSSLLYLFLPPQNLYWFFYDIVDEAREETKTKDTYVETIREGRLSWLKRAKEVFDTFSQTPENQDYLKIRNEIENFLSLTKNENFNPYEMLYSLSKVYVLAKRAILRNPNNKTKNTICAHLLIEHYDTLLKAALEKKPFPEDITFSPKELAVVLLSLANDVKLLYENDLDETVDKKLLPGFYLLKTEGTVKLKTTRRGKLGKDKPSEFFSIEADLLNLAYEQREASLPNPFSSNELWNLYSVIKMMIEPKPLSPIRALTEEARITFEDGFYTKEDKEIASYQKVQERKDLFGNLFAPLELSELKDVRLVPLAPTVSYEGNHEVYELITEQGNFWLAVNPAYKNGVDIYLKRKFAEQKKPYTKFDPRISKEGLKDFIQGLYDLFLEDTESEGLFTLVPKNSFVIYSDFFVPFKNVQLSQALKSACEGLGVNEKLMELITEISKNTVAVYKHTATGGSYAQDIQFGFLTFPRSAHAYEQHSFDDIVKALQSLSVETMNSDEYKEAQKRIANPVYMGSYPGAFSSQYYALELLSVFLHEFGHAIEYNYFRSGNIELRKRNFDRNLADLELTARYLKTQANNYEGTEKELAEKVAEIYDRIAKSKTIKNYELYDEILKLFFSVPLEKRLQLTEKLLLEPARKLGYATIYQFTNFIENISVFMQSIVLGEELDIQRPLYERYVKHILERFGVDKVREEKTTPKENKPIKNNQN